MRKCEDCCTVVQLVCDANSGGAFMSWNSIIGFGSTSAGTHLGRAASVLFSVGHPTTGRDAGRLENNSIWSVRLRQLERAGERVLVRRLR